MLQTQLIHKGLNYLQKMKLFCLIGIVFITVSCSGKLDDKSTSQLITDKTVQASCGQCNFDMAGEGCDLAVKINGIIYIVDGTGIDDHGDAHAHDGFCAKVRKAKVSGSIENGRFKASNFELLVD